MGGTNLGSYAAGLKREIFEDLVAGREPRQGRFDGGVLKEGQAKGKPTMGGTRFLPHTITFEFVYSDATAGATVFSVEVDAPERIVFLPVPEWVVETIWQGEIAGSYHFESAAMAMVDGFRGQLTAEANTALFGPQAAKRRE